jgi:hypothetical protein
MSLLIKVAVSAVSFLTAAAGVVGGWRLIAKNHASIENEQRDRRNHDQLSGRRHTAILHMLEKNDVPGAIDVLKSEISALRPRAPIAAVTCVVRETVPSLLVRNNGAVAEFSGKFRIIGPVKEPWDWAELRCFWGDSTQEWVTIAEGETRRIVLADRTWSRGVGAFVGSLSKWLIYGLLDGKLQTIESRQFGDAFPGEPVASGVVILEGFIIGNPDLANGLQPFRVTLGEHGATCERVDQHQPDVRLFLDWQPSILPDQFESSVREALEIAHDGKDDLTATHHMAIADSALIWPTDNGQQLPAVRCEVTNDSSTVITSVRVTLEVRRLTCEPNSEFIRSVDVEIPTMNAGENAQFYLYSTGSVGISIRLPDSLSFELPSDGQRRYVPIPAVRFPNWKFPAVNDLRQ